MNTKFLLGAAIVAVLNCATLNAQVLGGNAVGSVGGALGGHVGGMRDIGVVGQGSGHGAFGADLDTGSLRRTSGDLTHRAKDRTRDTLTSTRDRTRSTVNSARATAERDVGAAAITARSGVEMGASTGQNTIRSAAAASKQIDATATAAASGRSNAELDDSIAKPAALAASHQQLGAALEPQTLTQSNETSQRTPNASVAGALNKSVDASANSGRFPVNASGAAAAQGAGSVSRDDGVFAQSSAEGSASASLQK